jgi:predicted ArsR family transcriptional regulator
VSAPRFSDKFQLLLRYGDLDGRYGGDGSRVVAALILHGVNVGMPKSLVYAALTDPQNRGGFAALRRRRSNLQSWFDAEWKRAVVRARSIPVLGDRHEATVAAVELAERASALAWKGVGGATDYATYRYALAVAARAGRLAPLALGVRDVAEGVGIDRRTAARSLGRLVERRLLRRIAVGRGRAAALFAVEDVRNCPTVGALGQRAQLPHSGVRNCPTPSHTDVQCVGLVWGAYARSSDTWRYKGLGHTAERIYGYLDLDEAVTAQDLAGALRVTPGTVRRHLAALVEHGLAMRTKDGYRSTAVDPADLEDDLGVAGMAEAQRQRHELERQLHDEAVAAHAAHRAATPYVVDPDTGEITDVADLLDEPPGDPNDGTPDLDPEPIEHEVEPAPAGVPFGTPALASQIRTLAREPVDAWGAGPCRRCGQRTGLEDFAGGWLCSSCEPFEATNTPKVRRSIEARAGVKPACDRPERVDYHEVAAA